MQTLTWSIWWHFDVSCNFFSIWIITMCNSKVLIFVWLDDNESKFWLTKLCRVNDVPNESTVYENCLDYMNKCLNYIKNYMKSDLSILRDLDAPPLISSL